MQPCVDRTNLLICSVGYTVVLLRVDLHRHRFMIPYELQHPLSKGHMLLKHIVLALCLAIHSMLDLGFSYPDIFYVHHAPFWGVA